MNWIKKDDSFSDNAEAHSSENCQHVVEQRAPTLYATASRRPSAESRDSLFAIPACSFEDD
jgi:hypothetical protein